MQKGTQMTYVSFKNSKKKMYSLVTDTLNSGPLIVSGRNKA